MKKIIFIFLFLTSCGDYHYPGDVVCFQRGAMQEWLDSTNTRIAYYEALTKEQADSTERIWYMIDSIQSRPDYHYNKNSVSVKLSENITSIAKRKEAGLRYIIFLRGRVKTFEILMKIYDKEQP